MRKKSLDIPAFEDHERFFKFIKITDGNCWSWTGFTHDGYGKFNIKTNVGSWKQYMAHRVSYSIFKEITDNTLVIDHICRNRKCVNPDHLREVSTRDNVVENSMSFIAENVLKTHCPSGHEYSQKNTRISNRNGRYCLECKRIKISKIRSVKKCL